MKHQFCLVFGIARSPGTLGIRMADHVNQTQKNIKYKH